MLISTPLGPVGLMTGGSDGVPILFLHGVGSDKSVWTSQIDHFGKERLALAIDYPGYGESEALPDADRDDFARAALAVLDSLDVEQAHICGLSLGGIVAIAMSALAPRRCRSLILADSFAVHPDGQAIFDRSVVASTELGMAELARQRAPMLLAPNIPEAVRAEVIATMTRIDPAAYRIGARAVWLADQRERASAIDAPTLILCGDLDPVTPPSLSSDLARLVPNSTMHIITGASHIANLDRPDEFNRLVGAFIDAVDRNS